MPIHAPDRGLLHYVARVGWRRKSLVAGLPYVAPIMSGFLGLGGALVFVTTFFPAASHHRDDWVVRGLDAVAILSAAAVARYMRPSDRVWQHVAMTGAAALITCAILCSGGGSTALSSGAVYYLDIVYGFFMLTLVEAIGQTLVVLAMGVPALALQPGVGAGEQTILWGVAVFICALVACLVRAVDHAETDAMTGLPDRRGSERALLRAISAAGPLEHVGLAVIDIDHFKVHNDTFGAAASDRVLTEMAATWVDMLPAEAQLGRWGGDSFAVIAPGSSASQITSLVQELRLRLPLGVTCSAGTVDWAVGESASMVAARADSAVYTAKQQGRDRIFQHPGHGHDGREIMQALERGEFAVHFQPIVSMSTGETIGAEALIRWHHPERGMVSPMDFIPEAERSGVIVALGGWLLEDACTQASRWDAAADGSPLRLSVNASGRELQDPVYAATVEHALQVSGLPAARLVIELVESDYDVESFHLVSNLARLRQLGVRTAIDDFGTGHSSLERLRKLQADILKIDQSFVGDIRSVDERAPLVSAILALANALEMSVVAEGIETPAQAEWLRRHGCPFGQGYLFGRPARTLTRTEDAPVHTKNS